MDLVNKLLSFNCR